MENHRRRRVYRRHRRLSLSKGRKVLWQTVAATAAAEATVVCNTRKRAGSSEKFLNLSTTAA